ncbi:MAG: hypothetical protein ACRC14_16190, partial [Paracoccaceae bacterium]
ETTGGELAQPYWSFVGGITLRPSALTGFVTVTASAPVWSAAYVGLRVRYGRREIFVTEYNSPTVVTGFVISGLPPSYRITLQSAEHYRVGDAVIGQDTDFQGLVLGVNGNQIDVATIEFYDGPDIAEGLSGPRGSSDVTAKAAIPPLASPIWDEPLISPVRGYPMAGASAAGRLTLVDFPLVPDLIAMSSTRSIMDFEVGADDDDAIVRQCGDNAPRFRHVVNAGDLLLFSDRGLYYVSIRDGGILTPSSFNAILFDKRASSEVRPVSMDDGVVFVEASGQAIAAALLDGNVYLKWSVRTISTYHNHLIKRPIKLCGPSLFSELPERYLFVINSDGTLASMSWYEDFSPENVGFVPWETRGQFVSLSPMFGQYWAITDRAVGSGTARFIERFDDAAKMDCCCILAVPDTLLVNGAALTVNGQPLEVSVSAALPLAGATVQVYGSGYALGDRVVAVDGSVPGVDAMPAGSYCGFPFTTSVMPWPVEFVETTYAGMLQARLVRGSVSTMDTGTYSIRANKNTRVIGAYDVGDPLTAAPPLRTQVTKFLVLGVRDHPEIEISRTIPGDLQILAITQEVKY